MLSSTITLALGSATAGAGGTFAGVHWTPGREHTLGMLAFFVGAFVVTTSVLDRAVRNVNRPADVAFDEGWQSGYDKGWFEGRRAPKVRVLSTAADRVS